MHGTFYEKITEMHNQHQCHNEYDDEDKISILICEIKKSGVNTYNKYIKYIE